jgi:hypothetical protein
VKKLLAVAAFGAFVVIGAMQHSNVQSVTAALETALDLVVGEAVACPGGNGNGKGNGKGHGGANRGGRGGRG